MPFPVQQGIRCLALVAVLLVSGALHAGAAVYLKYGGIKGEVIAEGFEDQVEVFGLSFGTARFVTDLAQGSASDPFFNSVLITKESDRSTPLFFLESVNGSEQAEDVVITFVRTGNDKPEAYYEVKLTRAVVSSFWLSSSESRPVESFTIDFVKLTQSWIYKDGAAPLVSNNNGLGLPGSTILNIGAPPPPVTAFLDLADLSSGASGESGLQTDTSPTVSSITDTNVLEGASVDVPFQFQDPDTDPNVLAVGAESLDPGLVAPGGLVITRDGNRATLSISPVPGESGTADIRVTVSDGTDSDQSTFSLDVLSSDNPPTIDPIADQSTTEGTAINVDLLVDDPDTPVDTLTNFALSGDTALVKVENMVFSGTTNMRSVNIQPEPAGTGMVTLTIGVADGFNNATASFSLCINSGDPEAPSDITYAAPLQVDEHSPAGTLVATLGVVDPTPGDTHTFTLPDDAGGRFQVVGNRLQVLDPDRIDFETDSGYHVVIQVKDNEGLVYAESAEIQLLAVNEAPVVTVNSGALQGLSQQDILVQGIWVSDPDSAAADIEATLSVGDGGLTVSNPPSGVQVANNGSGIVTLTGPVADIRGMLGSAGNIKYRSFPNFSGTDILKVDVDDRGESGPGGPRITSAQRDIRVYTHGLEQWQFAQFGADRDNPALEATVWGNTVDFDLDGILNLIEYVLGLDPGDGQPVATWENLVVDRANRTIRLLVPALQDPRVSVGIEVASQVDPNAFSDDPSEIVLLSSVNQGNGFNLLTFQDQKAFDPENFRLYRLQATYTP